MGISLYYEARRERSLSRLERAAIDAAIERYPLKSLIVAAAVPAEEYNGEAFCVNPLGDVLPCPTEGAIAGLPFENVRKRSLRWIWEESDTFNRFRGTGWMPEPCRSCDQREIDFGGGCCQAALLTGDTANTDPACGLAPYHETIAAQAEMASTPLELELSRDLSWCRNP